MGAEPGRCLAATNLSAFIWSVADLLRGDYKQSDYGKVILPFTVLRRLDCVLEPTKAAVLEEKWCTGWLETFSRNSKVYRPSSY